MLVVKFQFCVAGGSKTPLFSRSCGCKIGVPWLIPTSRACQSLEQNAKPIPILLLSDGTNMDNL